MINHAPFGLVVLAAVALAAPATAQLMPHRALYELTLAEPSGGLTAADGAFAIEWRAACEGYTTQQRLWFMGVTEDGGSFDTDVRFASWESRDRAQLRFTMRSFSGGDLVEEYRGSAEVPADGSAGRAVYTVPEPMDVALPPGTVFPTEHLQRLLAAAGAGRTVLTEFVFDGSGAPADALTEVTAVIGGVIELETEPALRAWPMSLAYHDPTDVEGGVPLFELRFELTEQGPMRQVVLDYGDFALQATLGQMTWLPLPDDCR